MFPTAGRSRETVMKYARQDVEFLRKHKIKMIIAACGTVSSVIGTKPLVDDMPFTGVILPAVQAACGATKNGRIGVIGTPATIKSGSFGKAVKSINSHIFVVGNPCPLFVHLVENGYTDRNNKITRLVAEEYLAPIKAEGVDTLILGCTHYPLLRILFPILWEMTLRLFLPEQKRQNMHRAVLWKRICSATEQNQAKILTM